LDNAHYDFILASSQNTVNKLMGSSLVLREP